jgi:hypothetical protein
VAVFDTSVVLVVLPLVDTILRVFDALGLRVSVQPANTARDHDNKATLAC